MEVKSLHRFFVNAVGDSKSKSYLDTRRGFVLGLGAKMFIIAGPVLVYGISASVIYGIILYIISLF